MSSAIERLVALETQQKHLDERLDRIESKLDKLLERPNGLSTAGQATLATVIAGAMQAAEQLLKGHH